MCWAPGGDAIVVPRHALCGSMFDLIQTRVDARRDRDSNPGPWHCCRAAVFKTAPIGRSGTPPA